VDHAFPCGTLALDFVGTLRARRNAEPAEKLDVPARLDSWFAESGLASGLVSAPDDLVAALDLREAMYSLFAARIHAQDLKEGTVDRLNAAAAEVPLAVVLRSGGRVRHGSVRQALSNLAREAIEIVGGDDAALLRECSRPECTQIYLDRSRGHRREWCAMATCGNRVKASTYRARQRDAAS
jgi:predicted RNA-binding Zn ribbon-like protein